MKIGEILTEENIGGWQLTLMDRLVLYEALTAYSRLLESGRGRTKIRNCQARIKDLMSLVKDIRIENFIRGACVDIEELLNWADHDFKDGASLNVNTEYHEKNGDLPF